VPVEVFDSNPFRNTDYPKIAYRSPKSLQATVGGGGISVRPQPLQSAWFQIHCSIITLPIEMIKSAKIYLLESKGLRQKLHYKMAAYLSAKYFIKFLATLQHAPFS
jgi:hypothetical protein